MKRIFTSAFVILFAIGAANAQTTTPSKQHEGHRKEQRMGGYDNLNLTADQKAKMKTLHADLKKQMEDLKNQKLTDAERKTQMQQLHQQQQQRMEAILTADQKAQLEKNKAEWKAKGKEDKKDFKRGGDSTYRAGKNWKDRGDRKGADLQKELNLTTDQQAKVTQIRASYKTKFEALRNDNTLSQDQKRTKMHELMQQQQTEIKSVLTKEQVAKMQSLRKNRSKNTK